MVYPLNEAWFCPLLQMTIAAVMGMQAVYRIELAETGTPICEVDCGLDAHFDTVSGPLNMPNMGTGIPIMGI